MFFYQVMIVGLFLINIPISKNKINEKMSSFFAYAITFTVLALISGLKSINIGNDTQVYANLFYQSPSINTQLSGLFSQRFEGGYLILNKLLYGLYPNVQLLFITISVIVVFCWLFTIHQFSSNISASIFLLLTFRLYFMLLSNLRQSLAMGIVLISFYFLNKNKLLISVLLTLFAATFHVSALVFIIYILLRKVRVTKAIVAYSAVISVLGFIFFSRIFNIVLSIFPKYSSYLNTSYSSSDMKLSLILNFFVVLSVFIFGSVVLRNEPDNRAPYNSLVHKLHLILLIGVVISFIAIQFSMLNRVTSYFTMFIVLYIPTILSVIKSQSKRHVCYFIILTLFFTYNLLIMLFRPEWNAIVPYTTFWQASFFGGV